MSNQSDTTLLDLLRRSEKFSSGMTSARSDGSRAFAIIDITRRMTQRPTAAALCEQLSSIEPQTGPYLAARNLAVASLYPPASNDALAAKLLRSVRRAVSAVAPTAAEEIDTFLRQAAPFGDRAIDEFEPFFPTAATLDVLRRTILAVTDIDRVPTNAQGDIVELLGLMTRTLQFSDCVILSAGSIPAEVATVRVKQSKRTFADTIASLWRTRGGATNDDLAANTSGGFWATLSQKLLQAVSPAPSTDHNVLRMREFIQKACAPSHILLERVVDEFVHLAGALARRQDSVDVREDVGEEAAHRLPETAPRTEVDWSKLKSLTPGAAEFEIDDGLDPSYTDADFTTTVPLPLRYEEAAPGESCEHALTNAAKQTWTSAAFLTVLDVVFPGLLHAAQDSEEGTYRLYLLLSSAAGNSIADSTAIEVPPWSTFRANLKFMECCRFAYKRTSLRRPPLVTPFSSVRALQQHVDGLLKRAADDSAERWNSHVLVLNRIVSDAIDGTTILTRELREHRRTAERNITPLTQQLVRQAKALALAFREADAARKAAGQPTIGDNQPVADAVATAEQALCRAAEQIELNRSFLQRAKQELAAREQEGFPLALHDWLKSTERNYFSRCVTTDFEPYEFSEYGQRYLSLLEIWCAGDQPLRSWQSLLLSIKRCIWLLNRAVEQSAGAVTLEASLGLVRAYALAVLVLQRGQQKVSLARQPPSAAIVGQAPEATPGQSAASAHIPADDKNGTTSRRTGLPTKDGYFELRIRYYNECSQQSLRTARDLVRHHPELKLAVDLVEVMRDERGRRWVKAESDYSEIARMAGEAGNIEVAARAGYAAMRSRAQQSTREERRGLYWAQGFLRVHASRSPFLANTEPALFVSYRRDTQDWIRAVCRAVQRSAPHLRLWVDYESIIDANSEFRAEMQLGLDRADWVVLVFSPGYFESHWCTYELTTALSRQLMNNQRLTWICLDSDCPAGSVGKPELHVREMARSASRFAVEHRFFESQLDEVLKQPGLSTEVLTAASQKNANEIDLIAGKIQGFAR